MKYFTQFMAAAAIALCTLLTFSSCNEEPELIDAWGVGKPTLSIKEGDAKISRTSVTIPVEAQNAEKIHYAVLAAIAPTTENPTPEIPTPKESDYKVAPAYGIQDNNLVLPISEFGAQGTYYIYIYASNPKYAGEPAMTTVEYSNKELEALLTFEVKNATPYSLDVAVEKSELCETYVVTVIRQSAYNEASFISSAKASIEPTQSQIQYGKQPFVVNTESTTLSESRLAKSTRYNTDECAGVKLSRKDETNTLIKYMVAAYGIDQYGNDGIYTSEPFALPDSPFTAAPTVEITTATTFTKMSATYKVTGKCAKFIYGSMVAVDPQAKPAPRTEAFWDPANEANIIAFLKNITSSTLIEYPGKPIAVNLPLIATPGEKIVTYAFGISDDGQIGPISYKIDACQLPNLNGSAKVSSLTFKETKNVPNPQISWNVTYPANTTKLRFLVSDKANFTKFFSGTAAQTTLEWTMSTDESPNGYGWWDEVSVAQLAAANNVYTTKQLSFFDTEFVIRVIAQDTHGKWGEITSGTNQKTLPENYVDKSIDFALGIGQITVNISKMETVAGGDPQYPTSEAIYSITKGANTEAAYIIKIQDNTKFKDHASLTYENLLPFCQSRMDKENILKWPAVNVVVFDQTYSPDPNMFNNPNAYGVSAHVIITKDTAGNFKIAGVIAAGSKTPIYPAASN